MGFRVWGLGLKGLRIGENKVGAFGDFSFLHRVSYIVTSARCPESSPAALVFELAEILSQRLAGESFRTREVRTPFCLSEEAACEKKSSNRPCNACSIVNRKVSYSKSTPVSGC